VGNEVLRAIQRARDRVPLPSKVSELFENGALRPQYIEHRPATRVLVKYHRRAAEKAPIAVEDYGIQQAARTPLVGNQLAHRCPWAVMWLKDGKKYRTKKTNIHDAVHLRNRLHEHGIKNATVVSLCRCYYIPVELIGKLPRPWVWCPMCMKPRKYRRVEDRTIHAIKKEWNESKGRYEEKERLVALLRCPMCGLTNRNTIFRKSNQPFELRRFKQGATRARKRRRRRSIKRRR
jgi:hypothetical protein